MPTDPLKFRLGEYVLTRQLGSGGMAAVWAGHHVRVRESEVAVKVLTSDRIQETVFSDSLLNEARSHASLLHPNIIRMLDHGYVRPDDQPPPGVDGIVPFLVMEQGRGTLSDALPFASWADVSLLLRSVLDALAYAHARGVIHRDIKPANILLGREEETVYKLTDFGIAHPMRLQEFSAPLSDGRTVGTPAFMPPEQLRGARADFGPWTDLYAIGCLAYAVVSGQPPFRSSKLIELAQMHLTRRPPVLRPRFEVPEGFEGWVRRLLVKDPQHRYRCAADALWALQSLDAGAPSSPATAVAPSSPATAVAGGLEAPDFGMADTEVSPTVIPTTDAPTPDSGASPVVRAPVPARWEQLAGENTLDEGLGLFALRAPRAVGMEEQRERIWALFRETVEQRRPRVVVLRGGGSAPVADLADWFGVHAAEVGAARHLHVSGVRARTGGSEGLAELAAEALRLTYVTDAALRQRIRQAVAAGLPSELLESRSELFARDVGRARGLEEPPPAGTRNERFRAYADLLAAEAERRPVVAVFHDAHSSAEVLAFGNHFAREGSGAVTILLLVDDDLVEPTSVEERVLGELVDAEPVEVLQVVPYDDAEREELVESMLPFGVAGRRLLAQCFGDDAVALRACIAELIDSGALMRTAEGYQVLADRLPATTRGLWRRRIERALDEFPEREAVARLLASAGALGRVVDVREFEEVAAHLGIDVPARFEEVLATIGLVDTRRAGEWRFVHRELVEELRHGPDEAALNEVCAIVLERHATTAPALERVARHWERAGNLRFALSALVRAAQKSHATDVHRARRMVDRGMVLVNSLALDDTDVLRIDWLNADAATFLQERRLDLAAERASQAEERAVHVSYLRGCADAARTHARVMVGRGRFEEALGLLEHLVKTLPRLGDREELANCRLHAGYAAYRLGRLDEAEAHYQAAASAYGQLGRREQHASTLAYLAGLHVSRASWERARQIAEAACEAAREAAAPTVLAEAVSVLAEIARFLGDYETARDRYLESKRWRQLLGGHKHVISDLNLGLVEMAAGNYRAAGTLLEKLAEDEDPEGFREVLTIARATCLVGLGARDSALSLVDAVRGDLSGRTEADRDLAWSLEQFARASERAGERRWSEEFFEHSAAEYRRLGDEERADEVAAHARQ